MTRMLNRFLVLACVYSCLAITPSPADENAERVAPAIDEKQLPFAMHSQMEQLPSIRVGTKDADLIGSDNRVLQAAVDYVAGLGGESLKSVPANTSCEIRFICVPT